jgi:carboxyl-terminal processing protease
MNRPIKIVIIALSLAVFSYAALGYVLRTQSDDQKAYRSLTVYGEVLQKIQDEYVEEPNMAKVSAGGLHGLLESLDAMSSYMSAEEYAQYQKQLAAHPTGQIGAVLSKRFGYVMIVSTQPGSPAEKAGLLPGDIVEAIAGLTTREMSTEQALQLLSGAPGTTVKVSVISRGRGQTETEDKSVTLATLTPAHITVTKIAPDTAYVRVPSLDFGKADELRSKLVEMDRDGVKKLILDVRGCALGDDSEGIAAARLFISSGNITTLKGQTVAKQDFPADPSKVVWKNTVAVLTSGAASGAAEVLAGAIEGNKRGDVIGERTFGMASQQKLIQLDDGAAVNLTVAFYYTPDGKSIPENGVSPTVEVTNNSDDPVAYSLAENPPLTPVDVHADPVLSKALELVNGANGARKAAERRLPRHSRNLVPVIV